MGVIRLLLRRIAIGLLTLWVVLSVMFGLLIGSRDWGWDRTEGPMRLGGASAEEIAEAREMYYAERGMDASFGELYIEWILNMITLQWGTSWESGDAVVTLVLGATMRTGLYVVPAILLAVLLGVLLGTFAAIKQGSKTDGVTRSLTYLLFGLPNFWIGAMIVMGMLGAGSIAFARHQAVIPQVEYPFAYEYVLPVLLVASTLAAGLVTTARAQSLEYISSDVVKLVRAKGGGSVAIARHVLRNSAIPLVSLIFAETLALLVLSIFVIEALFGIEGIGLVFYNAVWEQDIPVLLGGTMVIVAVGIIGNILQDISHSTLDPRIELRA